MRNRNGWVLAGLIVLLSGTASATLLSDIQAAIVADGFFQDSIDGLTFTFTSVEENTAALDLSKIDLTLVDDGGGIAGFDLTPTMIGAFAVENGVLADLKLEFMVESVAGILAVGNTLSALITPMAIATLSELIMEVPGVDVGVSNLMPVAEESLGGVFEKLTINSKNIVLMSAAGGRAEVLSINQRFAVVPEPGTAGLLLLGLTGLGWLTRRI